MSFAEYFILLLHLVLFYLLFSALNFYVKVGFSVCQDSVPICFVLCYLCILWISPTAHTLKDSTILMSFAFLCSINHFMRWVYVWNDLIDFLLWVTFPVHFGKFVCMLTWKHTLSLCLPVHAYLSFIASLSENKSNLSLTLSGDSHSRSQFTESRVQTAFSLFLTLGISPLDLCLSFLVPGLFECYDPPN